LTGESLPQIKTGVMLEKHYQNFNPSDFKNHILFAGTDILSVNPIKQGDQVEAIVLKTGV
jgi:magnesium-transporting ATPase (P-type)